MSLLSRHSSLSLSLSLRSPALGTPPSAPASSVARFEGMIFKQGDKFSEDIFMEIEPIAELELVDDKINSLSSEASCLEETSVLDLQGVLPLKPVNLRLFDPSIHFRDGEFTESSSTSSDQMEDEDALLDCQTPTKTIFDPFSPGGDEFMLAPKKKMLRVSYVPLRQQLNFDAESDSEENLEANAVKYSDEEEQFLELIFNSLLEMIISTQLSEISAENMLADSDPFEDCKTPTSLLLLKGIAEICPPAPMRSTFVLERHGHSICRKLDFESNLN